MASTATLSVRALTTGGQWACSSLALTNNPEFDYYSSPPSTTTAPATVTAQDESVLFTRIQLAF